MPTIFIKELTSSLGYLDLHDVATDEINVLRACIQTGDVTGADAAQAALAVADLVCDRLLDLGNISGWDHAARVAREIHVISQHWA